MNGIVRKWREHVLSSGDIDKRLRGVEKLAESGDKEAVTLLMSILDDPASEVRANAASALATMGDPRATKSLVVRVLVEREHRVLEQATLALASVGTDPGLASLAEALADDDIGVRQAAARALRRVGWDRMPDKIRARVAILQDEWAEAVSYGPAAVDPLHSVLHEGTPTARRRAAEALGSIGTTEALNALVDVMKSPDVDVSHQKIAAWGIRRICWEDADDTDLARAAIMDRDWFGVASFGKIAVGPLVEVLREGDADVTVGAAQALNEIQDPVALEALHRALEDPMQDVDIRQLITELFAERDDTGSREALVSALSDESWSVRVAAADALENRNWQPGSDEEKALVSIVRKDWEALASIGEPAVQPLVGSLGHYAVGADAARQLLALGTAGRNALVRALDSEDDNPTIREVASIALAEAGDPRAIEPLKAMLGDADIAVRQSAVWTLERLGWEPANRSEQAITALAHGDWDRLRGLGASAVEPLLQLAADSMARDETVATLDHILDVVPGRISIRQLQKLVSIEDLRSEYGTVPQAESPKSSGKEGGFGGIRKRAQRELLRRGIPH